MKNKYFNFALLFLFGFGLLSSCSKDNDTNKDNSSYKFIDQVMQGKIGGESWTFKVGTASTDYYDSTTFSFNFYSIDSENPCSEWLDGNRVFFSIPKKEGLYKLNFDANPQTATIFYEETTMNYISSNGAVEITKIDEENRIVEGKIDAQGDDNYFVNGNFTLTYCN